MSDTKLEAVVRDIMSAGLACGVDMIREGRVNMAAPLSDVFGDFPREFLRIRPSIVDTLRDALDAEATS